MKLIDIEKVINDPSVFAIGKEEIEKYTVKAIPIEWIKEHYGWLTMAGEIIKDWEKENADNN